MKNRDLIIYRIVTGLMSLLAVMGAGMYFFNYELAESMYINLNFPTYIIYPLGIAKLLGVFAIWYNKSRSLTEWAYAGFFFNSLLAISAHLNINDGEHYGAVVALVLAVTSYIYNKKLYA